MIEKLILLFKIPELRRKLLLTITLLAVYRMGFWIPLPFVDQGVMKDQIKQMRIRHNVIRTVSSDPYSNLQVFQFDVALCWQC